MWDAQGHPRQANEVGHWLEKARLIAGMPPPEMHTVTTP